MDEADLPPQDLRRLVEVLNRHGVEFVVVGGSAAQLHGAQRLTNDTDCVVSQAQDNLERLAGALRELNARLRVAGLSDNEARKLPVQIDAKTLGDMKSSTWTTDAGPFDVLSGLATQGAHLTLFEELAKRQLLTTVDGIQIRVAGLTDIITAKEHADRPKDHDALPELRALQADRERVNRVVDESFPRTTGGHAPSLGEDPSPAQDVNRDNGPGR